MSTSCILIGILIGILEEDAEDANEDAGIPGFPCLQAVRHRSRRSRPKRSRTGVLRPPARFGRPPPRSRGLIDLIQKSRILIGILRGKDANEDANEDARSAHTAPIIHI